MKSIKMKWKIEPKSMPCDRVKEIVEDAFTDSAMQMLDEKPIVDTLLVLIESTAFVTPWGLVVGGFKATGKYDLGFVRKNPMIFRNGYDNRIYQGNFFYLVRENKKEVAKWLRDNGVPSREWYIRPYDFSREEDRKKYKILDFMLPTYTLEVDLNSLPDTWVNSDSFHIVVPDDEYN